MKKLMFILMAILLINACKKDDDDDNNVPMPTTFEDQLVGQYSFQSAIFMQAVTMYNVMAPGDTVIFPEGSDASGLVGGVLLQDSPCNNVDQTLLDMRDDLTLYYTCIGENEELQMGTWSANENDKSVTLNVVSEIGPIAVKITNVVITNTNFTGVINGLPVPVDYSQPIGATNVQMINVSVVFMIE